MFAKLHFKCNIYVYTLVWTLCAIGFYLVVKFECPKINQFHIQISSKTLKFCSLRLQNKNICWFKVLMGNLFIMKVSHGFCKLKHDVNCDNWFKWTFMLGSPKLVACNMICPLSWCPMFASLVANSNKLVQLKRTIRNSSTSSFAFAKVTIVSIQEHFLQMHFCVESFVFHYQIQFFEDFF